MSTGSLSRVGECQNYLDLQPFIMFLVSGTIKKSPSLSRAVSITMGTGQGYRTLQFHFFQPVTFTTTASIQTQSQHREVVKEGILSKKGRWNTSWKERYFVLNSSYELKYFSNETEKDHPDRMKGSVSLYRASISTTMPVHDIYIIEICTADKRFKRNVLVLGTKSEDVHAGWMKHLEAASKGILLYAIAPAKPKSKDPVIPARCLRRAMAALDPKQERQRREIGAGQIWDFWAVKANAVFAGGAADLGDAVDDAIDFLQGPPALAPQEEAALRRRQQERQERRELSAREQRKLVERVHAAVVPGWTPAAEAAAALEEEEAALQREQLAFLQERFEGTLTLL